jgi:esterase/lipase superfamily enzyme
VQQHSAIERQEVRAPGEEQAYGKCRNLEILLITNRALSAKFQLGPDGVLPQRGEELLASLAPAPQFGVVDVQVQARSHDPPATRIDCRDADGRPAAATAVILRQARILDRKAFLAIAGRAGGGFDDRAPFLVFVHGYRVSFRDGVETAARLSGRMRNEMRPVLVSWPSAGTLRNYGQDGVMASGSPAAVRSALETLASVPPPRPITLVAHSMGNRIALDALESMRAAGRTGILDELASVAPDVQCERYASIMQKLQGAAKPADRMFRRGTLYLYENDYALKASKKYWWANDKREVCRMGSQRGPAAAAGANALEPVDWSCINEIVDSHSYYVLNDHIARDLRDAVLSRKVPKDRDLEFIQVPPSSRYFLYPGAIDRACAGVQ